MTRSRLSPWARALLGVLAALGAFAALSAIPLQRRLLFPGTERLGNAQARVDARGEQLWIATPEGRVEAWLLSAHGPRSIAKPLVLYAHGNGELIDDWAARFEPARAAGLGVLLVEYPGYGRSAGEPSESAIRETMRAAYDAVASRSDVDGARIVGHGRSLGGGAIAALSRDRKLRALVLESTFTSVGAVASEHGLPGWLMRDRFDSESALREFGGPTLLLHGRRDALIPLRHALSLREVAKGALLRVEECGHNGCPDSWPRVEEFLRSNDILSPRGAP